jgi:6-phosphogluconolactonase
MDIRTGDQAFVVETLAADVAAEASRVLATRASFTIALPGGSVASWCFPRLATLPLDWSRVEFFWVDERAVPPTDPESNYALARSQWLDPAGVPETRVHRMRAEERDLAAAARAYADELRHVAGDPPRLDYVVLGVGPDGHVASLFPGHAALADTGIVVAVEDAPKPPPRRLSLTMPVLEGAARVAIVAFGTQKAAALRDAVSGDGTSPVARVARAAHAACILADAEAARLLNAT